MVAVETEENFTNFLEQVGTELVNKTERAFIAKRNEDVPREIKAIYLAFLEDQDAVMDQIVKLFDDKTIKQDILELFIEKIGELSDIISKEKNKALDKLNIKAINNLTGVKKILNELSEEKFKEILIALKKF